MFNVASRLSRSNLFSRHIIQYVIMISAFGFVVGCQTVSPVVKIGLVGPFEGRHRPIGYDTIYSARLAVQDVNNAGGIGKYRVALVALDDSGEPEFASATARSLVIDPGVVAVIGHWLPDTTDVAKDIYREADMPFIMTGEEPFGQYDPRDLPNDFLHSYEEITPFDETAGPFAGTAYDAVNLVLTAMYGVTKDDGIIDRSSMAKALDSMTYQGLTGEVYQP